MNLFNYIQGLDASFELALFNWEIKCDEYLQLYFGGNRENVLRTPFGDCISKVEIFNQNVDLGEDLESFRGVKDNQDILQAAAIIQVQEVDVEEQRLMAVAIDSLTNAPWNIIQQTQVETCKGAATSLMEGIVLESQSIGFGGIVKAITIPRARPFYRKIGFVETNGSGEMILTVQAAQEFLLKQQQLRQNAQNQ
ncbi:MAG: hypothetical protein KME64_24715 [Scytonematopsis contorta HA4267-MV1]|jgi:hypothetical protein|nr:hypothetical protein [Scytonematopsis contorta HA4267-MV1]